MYWTLLRKSWNFVSKFLINWNFVLNQLALKLKDYNMLFLLLAPFVCWTDLM